MNYRPVYLLSAILFSSGSLFGQMIDYFVTDRLGYTGTAVRYDSMDDLLNGVNVQDTVTIGNRDVTIFYVEDAYNIVMGSWWYSTQPEGEGYGNTSGNTGVGFMQLYDDDFSTVDSASMDFDGWDGTYWTEAQLSVQGSNAGSSEYARFSSYTNTNDAATYFSFDLSLKVGGLEGVETSPGWVEALNHPTSVWGSFNAIFAGPADGANQGFYALSLTFDMDNWSWENRESLIFPEGGFYDSYFAAAPVPEPSTVGLIAVASLGGLLYLRRRLKK